VAITWERVLAVNFPHKIQAWTSKKNTYIYIATVLLFFAVINSHFLFGYKLYKDEDDPSCSGINDFWRHYDQYIFNHIDFAKYSVLPFIGIIVGNILIVGRMIYAKRMARRQLNVDSSNSSQVSQITVMLLGLSLTFLVLNLPISIMIILLHEDFEYSDYQLAWIWFAWSIGQLLMYTNNAVNFYIYCLSGSRYRNEVRALLCKKHASINNTNNRNIPANTT